MRLDSASLEHLQFEVFVGNENLSSPWVKDLFQDQRGFVWLATNNNLVRYDSQRFTAFTPNPDKTGSFPSNKPLSIQSDSSDNIWITSPEALSRFEASTETFENFTLQDATGKNLLQSSQALILASNNQLLLGSLNGLFIFDPSQKTWTHQYRNIGGEDTRVREIIEINPGEFLLGTSSGIWRFDLKSEQFFPQTYVDREGQDIGRFDIISILVDRQNRLWICTESDRLYCFSDDGIEQEFTVDGVPASQLNLTGFSTIFQDRDGTIWAAPGQRGLIALPTGSLDFKRLESDIGASRKLERNVISTLHELNDGTLCFGTTDSGVLMLDSKRLPIDLYPPKTLLNQLAIGNVRRLTGDTDRSVWISGSNGQLQRFDLETHTFDRPLADSENLNLLKKNSFQSITSDDQGNLFILNGREVVFYDAGADKLTELAIDWEALGTKKRDYPETLHYDAHGILWLIGGRIYQHNPLTNESIEVASPKRFPDGRFRGFSVAELANGNLWIGTRLRGIHLYDRQSNSITRSFTERGYPTLMNERILFDLTVDHQGNVWVASSLGLMMFDSELNQLDLFHDLVGIGDSSVNGLEFDHSGHLWLTSTRGLYRLDPEKRQARRFTQSQGVPPQTFANKAMAISINGILTIGSLSGLNVIDTLNMANDQIPPIPTVTSLLSSNNLVRPIEISRKNLLIRSITDDLKLDHHHNNITFQFTSFDYSNDPNITLLYKIDGLIEQWTSIGKENELTFPSLPPGEFVFRIKAANGNLNSDESSIRFAILPPFWKTNIFVSIFSLFLLLTIILFIRRKTHSITATNRKLERLVKDRTLELEKSKEEALRARDEAERANKAKSDFLANLSHEIRTPMNGIIGMNHMLLEANLEPQLNQYARTVGRNAESMLSLINDILDISKIEAGKFVLENEDFDIQAVVEDAIELFTVEAQEKGIDLRSFPDANLPTLMNGDPLRVKQAVMNLVANAVKFTASGSVSVYLRLLSENADSAHFECSVKDTGIGIPVKAWPRLFETFTQADSSTTRNFGGTGLGLSITKNLVKAMDGDARFESEEDKGSVFIITFKLRKVKSENTLVPNGETLAPSIGKTLIAFTDTEIRKWLKTWLMKSGDEVSISSQSSEIIECLQNGVSNLLIDKQIVNQPILNQIRAAKSKSRLRVLLFQNFTESFRRSEFESGIIDHYESYPIRPTHILNILSQEGSESKSSLLPTAKAETTPSSYTGKRVLLVDDNKMNQEVLKALLSKSGIQADEASSGREGIEMSLITKYALIFMDCMMPEIDGYEATRIIRDRPGSLNSNTPIIALTANDMEGDREKCLEAGMDDYLTKPVLPKSLSSVLAIWVSKVSAK